MTSYGATYGKFLYGSELYGTTSTYIPPGQYQWIIEIDWNNDGAYDGWNDADRLIEFQCNRGRKNFIQPNGSGFYPISVGVLHLILDNHDGRYDPWNLSSPMLYPGMTLGGKARVRVVDIDTSTIYNFFFGFLSDVQPSGYGANAIVKITIEDGLRLLRESFTPVALTEGDDVITAVDNILSTWRYGSTISGSGMPTIPYFWSFLEKSDADIIKELTDLTFGDFFIMRDGKAKYIEVTSTSTAAATIDKNILQKDIGNPFPWLNLRNSIKYEIASMIQETTASDVFVLENEALQINGLPLLSGDTYGFVGYIDLKQGSFTFAKSLTVSTYTANESSDGTGADKTANITHADVASYGVGAQLRIGQNTTSESVFVTSLTVTGDVYVANKYIVFYPENNPNDPKVFSCDTPWMQTLETARTQAERIYALLSVKNKTPIITMINRPAEQFLELFDVITLTISTLGISDNFKIGGIEHHGTPQEIYTTYYLEPIIT